MNVRIADLGDAAERGRIDDYVAAHPDAELYHRPQWTIAVEEGCRQRGHYLVAEGRGGLIGCLPLVVQIPILTALVTVLGFYYSFRLDFPTGPFISAVFAVMVLSSAA